MFDDSDPRTTGEHIRRIRGGAHRADVVVVGVVHDHPASTYRVRAVVGAVDPSVLALELPPLAVPLFERYAATSERPPADGGEMSAAIQAATTAAVVGIDGPSLPFLWRLARTLYREDVDRAAVSPLLGGLASVTTHAVACRLAAGLGRRTPGWLPVESPVAYDCALTDDPGAQVADERAQIRRAATVSNVFGEPSAVAVRDLVREAHMADRLADLRRRGTVVAVVGRGHLDGVAGRLA